MDVCGRYQYGRVEDGVLLVVRRVEKRKGKVVKKVDSGRL